MQNQNIIVELYHDLCLIRHTHVEWFLQIAVIVVALTIAFWVNAFFKKQLIRKSTTESSRHRFDGILFFFLSYLIIQLSKLALTNWIPSLNLLHGVSALLLTLLSIRFLRYLLQRIWHQSVHLAYIEKYLAIAIWLIFVFYMLGAFPKIVDALDSVSFHVGKNPVSLLLVCQGLISIAMTLLLSLWLGREIEHRVMVSEMMGVNARVMLVKLTWSLLAAIAVLLVLSLLGIDPTVLSVFGGAFGVGLGLSLQTVASNYISGFIILLDKSVKIGDLIELNNRQGQVTELTARYVVLKGLDGIELLIPNQTIMTSVVINYSYTDKKVWTSLSFLVAYHTDLDLAMKLMLSVLVGKPRIATTPEPRAFLKSFGENGVSLELGFWLLDPENGSGGLCSEISLEVWKAFRNNGINIH